MAPKKTAARKAGKPARKTPQRRSYHHGNLRQALIDATLMLVEERGSVPVTVRDAALRVGVSSAAPFRHFPNRERLMAAVAEEAQGRFRAEIDHALERVATDADPMQRFAAMGDAYLRWAFANPAHFRIISSRADFDYDASAALLRDNDELIAHAEGLLAEAQRRDLLRFGDVRLALLAGRALAYGLARMHIDGQLPRWGVAASEARQLCERVLRFYVTAIGVQPSDRPKPKQPLRTATRRPRRRLR